MIYAIDPGSERSAIVGYESGRSAVLLAEKWPNDELLGWLRERAIPVEVPILVEPPDVLVIETFEPRGQPLYRQLVTTAIWIGRFMEAVSGPRWSVELMSREAVKRHLLGTSRGGDPNVRAALADRFGGRLAAKGTKKARGPLYGVSGDCWAALAVAVTLADQRAAELSAEAAGVGA